eukprot:768369-Hanusia_phi.AAC.5
MGEHDVHDADEQMKGNRGDMPGDGAMDPEVEDQDGMDNADSQADSKDASQQQRQKRTHWPKDDERMKVLVLKVAKAWLRQRENPSEGQIQIWCRLKEQLKSEDEIFGLMSWKTIKSKFDEMVRKYRVRQIQGGTYPPSIVRDPSDPYGEWDLVWHDVIERMDDYTLSKQKKREAPAEPVQLFDMAIQRMSKRKLDASNAQDAACPSDESNDEVGAEASASKARGQGQHAAQPCMPTTRKSSTAHRESEDEEWSFITNYMMRELQGRKEDREIRKLELEERRQERELRKMELEVRMKEIEMQQMMLQQVFCILAPAPPE